MPLEKIVFFALCQIQFCLLKTALVQHAEVISNFSCIEWQQNLILIYKESNMVINNQHWLHLNIHPVLQNIEWVKMLFHCNKERILGFFSNIYQKMTQTFHLASIF